MKYFKSIKPIISLIWILLILNLLGCGRKIVDNQKDARFNGTWEMEFTKSMPSLLEPWLNEDPEPIILSSVLTFESENFSLQIIAPQSYQYLNKEYAGKYILRADTIIFQAVNHSLSKVSSSFGSASDINIDLIEKLQFRFENNDSLKFNVISIAVSDSLMSLPMSSFLWSSGGYLPTVKTSGAYSRIGIE